MFRDERLISYPGRSIERGPEPETQPAWEELVTGAGRLHADFAQWATHDFGYALGVLRGYYDSLPENKKPGSIGELLDLVDWTEPEARDSFAKVYYDALREKDPDQSGQL